MNGQDVLWQDGQTDPILFDHDGWTNVTLGKINDLGQIIGNGIPPDSRYRHGFVLNPVDGAPHGHFWWMGWALRSPGSAVHHDGDALNALALQ
jgi:hypothetical protein